MVCPVLQSDQLNQVPNAISENDLSRGISPGHPDIIQYAEIGYQVVGLKDKPNGTAPHLRKLLIGQPRYLFALQTIAPPVGESRQPRRLSKVLLPEPEGPMIAT